MELKIKIRTSILPDVEEIIRKIRKIEKEYSCNCTLLEIEVN